jgi:hypothetical protein
MVLLVSETVPAERRRYRRIAGRPEGTTMAANELNEIIAASAADYAVPGIAVDIWHHGSPPFCRTLGRP